MGEWKKIKLKEVLTEINERNKGERVTKVLSVTNSQGFVSQEEYFEGTVHSENISNYKIVRKNQFAYNPSRVNVGSIDILKKYDEGALSPMYVIFEVDEIKLLPEYFKYYFQTHRFFENVKNNTQGSVRNSLNFKALADFEYLLPPIEEQKKIVSILDNVNQIINLYNIKIKKLMDKKAYVIEKILNNKDWLKTTIGDISEIATKQTGFDYSATIKPSLLTNSEQGTLPYLQTKNFKGIKFSYNTDYYIPKKIADMFPKINLDEKCILMSIVGASVGNIGYFTGETKCFLGGAICKLKLKNINLTELIYYELESKLGQNQIKKLIKGGAQDTITIEDIRKMKIILPKEEKEILRITNVFKQLDEEIIRYEKLMKLYDEIKKGLMQKLLTGKVRVKI